MLATGQSIVEKHHESEQVSEPKPAENVEVPSPPTANPPVIEQPVEEQQIAQTEQEQPEQNEAAEKSKADENPDQPEE